MLTDLVSEILSESGSGLVIPAFEETVKSILVSFMFISLVLVLFIFISLALVSFVFISLEVSNVLTWTTFSLSDTYFWLFQILNSFQTDYWHLSIMFLHFLLGQWRISEYFQKHLPYIKGIFADFHNIIIDTAKLTLLMSVALSGGSACICS